MADISLHLALEAKLAAGIGDACFADDDIVKLAIGMSRDGTKLSLTRWDYTSVFRLLCFDNFQKQPKSGKHQSCIQVVACRAFACCFEWLNFKITNNSWTH